MTYYEYGKCRYCGIELNYHEREWRTCDTCKKEISFRPKTPYVTEKIVQVPQRVEVEKIVEKVVYVDKIFENKIYFQSGPWGAAISDQVIWGLSAVAAEVGCSIEEAYTKTMWNQGKNALFPIYEKAIQYYKDNEKETSSV